MIDKSNRGLEVMNRRLATLTLFGVLLPICSACSVAEVERDEDVISMYKSVGSVQCGENLMTRENLVDEVAALRRIGVEVVSADCGLDDMMYASVCGSGTGEVWIIEVPSRYEGEAVSTGFTRVPPGAEYAIQSCK